MSSRSLPSRILATVFLGLACACHDVGTQAPGTVYGTPAAQSLDVTVADVFARAPELEGEVVRVTGTVTDVCAKRGCWIRIADESGPAEILFKVDDGVMVFPLAAKGQQVVADGVVARLPLSLEATREALAEEAAEAGRPFDPESVTEPTVVVRLDGLGALLQDPAR